MSWETVTVVRIYLTEADKLLPGLLEMPARRAKGSRRECFPRDQWLWRSGTVHSSSLLDLSLDLPVAVEFFDKPEKVSAILEHLADRIGAGHMIRWQAEANL